jgi:chromosome segregation protein
VEPTELVIEKGLTGVVGPNGCGKSNLLEALRWVMGENSQNLRAAAMDDVIFSGTQTRPARNTAEVTIFIDNSGRQAPSEFNAHDTLEVTRRIEREAGSAFRINGREVRARDVRILFEDAATGARSPALVRQGQIGELVNAKPSSAAASWRTPPASPACTAAGTRPSCASRPPRATSPASATSWASSTPRSEP